MLGFEECPASSTSSRRHSFLDFSIFICLAFQSFKLIKKQRGLLILHSLMSGGLKFVILGTRL